MWRGHLFVARQGCATWAQPPFGYTSSPKTAATLQALSINEAEAEMVRLMYRWLGEDGLSSYAITQRLQAAQFPTTTVIIQTGHAALPLSPLVYNYWLMNGTIP
jgi:hypothetical protein